MKYKNKIIIMLIMIVTSISPENGAAFYINGAMLVVAGREKEFGGNFDHRMGKKGR